MSFKPPYARPLAFSPLSLSAHTCNYGRMLEWIAFASLIGAVGLLLILAWIDLRTFLLPNELVLGFATLGLVFHLTTLCAWIAPYDILLGGLAGFGSLYLLRFFANRHYGADALGLGDVKLIGAAGLWLGVEGVMMALFFGASASLLHGLGYALYEKKKTGEMPTMNDLRLPAGPGFVAGIMISGFILYRNFSPLIKVTTLP